MKVKRKHQIRRLIAAIVLVGLMTIFTSVVIKKGIDADIQQQEIMLKNHFELINK